MGSYAKLIPMVREALNNAAENGYTFEGWTDEAVARDIIECTGEFNGYAIEGVAIAVRQVRGEALPG